MTRAELLQVAKPILFNTDMVMAILDDRKTVTRRVIKPQPKGAHSIIDCDAEAHTFDMLCGNGGKDGIFADWAEMIKAPFWPDDILYVRETWDNLPVNLDGTYCGYDKYYYKADGDLRPEGWKGNWKPSIHMLKRAARIFLRVTDVRVERLQDMPHDGPLKEGIHFCECPDGFTWKQKTDMQNCYTTPMGAMEALWNSTMPRKDLGRYGWDANPWVWVTEFERVEAE